MKKRILETIIVFSIAIGISIGITIAVRLKAHMEVSPIMYIVAVLSVFIPGIFLLYRLVFVYNDEAALLREKIQKCDSVEKLDALINEIDLFKQAGGRQVYNIVLGLTFDAERKLEELNNNHNNSQQDVQGS